MALSNKSLSLSLPNAEIAKMRNYVPGKCVSLAEVRKVFPDADYIVNTALFGMDTGEIISRVVADGKRYGSESSWTSTWGIAFGDEQGPRLSWDNGAKAPEFLGPYSSLVRDGVIGDGLNDKSKRGRTAIGLSKTGFELICIPDNCEDVTSTKALAQLMLDRGCTFAINLDGGGSSQFIAPSRQYSSGRKCPAWLAIWLKKDEKENAPVKPDIQEKEEAVVECICKVKTYTLDANGKKEDSRYIDKNDVCIIGKVTPNCLIEITYPTSKGPRTAYIKSLENFIPNPTKA